MAVVTKFQATFMANCMQRCMNFILCSLWPSLPRPHFRCWPTPKKKNVLKIALQSAACLPIHVGKCLRLQWDVGFWARVVGDGFGFGLADCGLHLCGCNWQIHTCVRVCVRDIKSDLEMHAKRERERGESELFNSG